MPYSSISREYLLREGLPSDQIIKTGSPMHEVLNYYLPKIKASKAIARFKLKPLEYFLFSVHREENVDLDKNFKKIVKLINTVAETYNMPVLISVHPRTRNRIAETGTKFHSHVSLYFGFFDYVNLQISKAVLSDSGTILRTSILNFPALNLREAHERPEGMEEAAVMLVGLSTERVLQALMLLETQMRGQKRNLNLVDDYNLTNVSEKVVRIIYSYTDYVNRVVWKKYKS